MFYFMEKDFDEGSSPARVPCPKICPDCILAEMEHFHDEKSFSSFGACSGNSSHVEEDGISTSSEDSDPGLKDTEEDGISTSSEDSDPGLKDTEEDEVSIPGNLSEGSTVSFGSMMDILSNDSISSDGSILSYGHNEDARSLMLDFELASSSGESTASLGSMDESMSTTSSRESPISSGSSEQGRSLGPDSAYGSTVELHPLGFDPRIDNAVFGFPDIHPFLRPEDEIIERRNTPVDPSPRRAVIDDNSEGFFMYVLLATCMFSSIASAFIYTYCRVEVFTGYIFLISGVIGVLIKCFPRLNKICARRPEENAAIPEERVYMEHLSVV